MVWVTILYFHIVFCSFLLTTSSCRTCTCTCTYASSVPYRTNSSFKSINEWKLVEEMMWDSISIWVTTIVSDCLATGNRMKREREKKWTWSDIRSCIHGMLLAIRHKNCGRNTVLYGTVRYYSTQYTVQYCTRTEWNGRFVIVIGNSQTYRCTVQ